MNDKLTSDWLIASGMLLLLAPLVTLSIHTNIAVFDTAALLVTLAVVCSWLGSTLVPSGAKFSFSLLAAWSATMALAFLLLLMTPVYPGPWQDGVLLTAGVLVQGLFFCVLFQLMSNWSSDGFVTRALVTVLIAAAAFAPLYLGEAFSHSQFLLNAVIATSPISYLAGIVDYDYLRSAWFYGHTPFGGLRYEYQPIWAVTAFYFTTIILAETVNRLKHN